MSLVASLVWLGCESTSRKTPPAVESEVDEAPTRPNEETEPGLDAAWAVAIAAEPDGDGVYIVDSFVAAWLFDRASKGEAHEWAPIEPDLRGEPAGGYRLEEISTGMPYARLGLEVGDVVETLNGVVLSSPDRFGFALDGAESLVVVRVHRDGARLERTFQLVPGAAWIRQLAGYAGEPDPTLETTTGTEPEDDPVAVAEDAQPVRSPAGSRPSKRRPTREAPRSPSTPSVRRPPPSPIRCASSRSCTVTRSHFDRLVSAPSRLQTQVEVVPAIRNDVFSGYKLKKVRPGSDAARLGFRSGDKITQVNGYDLTNESEALQLYVSLGASRVFKIRYERGGRRSVKTITVV
jgi:hypothetical protein